MPRFTEDEMKEAVLKVTEEGLCVNRVAKENGLCKKTLKSYVDKYLNNFGYNGKEIRFRPNYEINQVFTHQHEQVFEDHLISLDCAQHKVTRDFVREEAYNFATMCNVHVPKTWNVRKQAGLDWMYSFLNRHPKVRSIIVRNKKNVQTSTQIVNHEITNENNIIPIVDIPLEDDDYLSDDELQVSKIVSNHYVNRDAEKKDVIEDSNVNDDYSSKIKVKSPLDEFLENLTLAYGIVAENGFVNAKQVYNLGEIALIVDESLSRNGEQILVTACCFFNAAGDYLPPFFVFPWKEWHSSALENLPEGAVGIVRPTGRLDDDAFSLVLEHFQSQIKATPTHKIVLVMDVDEHHITINSLDFCQKHGIEVVTLPPHYGSNLQPAERYIYPTIRLLFNRCLHHFHAREHTYLTGKRIATLFCRIQKIAFSSDHIRKGFSENGIFPLNDAFITNEFISRKIDLYEPFVSLTEILLDFPDTIDDDESVFSDTGKSPIPYSPPRRNVSFGKTPIEEFFNNLVQAYRELEAHEGLKPQKIYNVDEFEISVSILDSGQSNVRISVCCCANAFGEVLPPYIVVPKDKCSPTMMARDIPDMKRTTSADGCIDNAIFLQMLQYFQQCIDASLSNPIILIMDCENDHISLKTIEFCELNGIILVTVPPHITEIFQPLERTVFQTVFQVLKRQFMEMESKTLISQSIIVDLLAKTFETCFTAESIISGFKISGLWPLDHDLIVPNSMWLKYFDVKDETNCNVFDEDVKTDEKDSSAFSDLSSDDTSSISDSEVVLFYNKIEDFLRSSSDNQLYVLGELRLATCSVVTHVKLFVNAVGTILPPYLIYSTDADDVVLRSSLGVTCYRCEKNVDDQHMLLMSVKHFREHSLVSEGRKILLLLEDTHFSRLTQTLREFGEDNGIMFTTFPYKDREYLHPLENSFMKTLKQRFEETQYQINSINDVIGFLEQAFIELYETEEIVAKFKEHGICSINRSILVEEEGEDELNIANIDAYSNGDLKDYDDFIIEEEVEVTVDEELCRPG